MGRGGEISQQGKDRKISLEELSQHRTPGDGRIFLVFAYLLYISQLTTVRFCHNSSAWLSHKGKVYDVSGWEDHPGKLSSRHRNIISCADSITIPFSRRVCYFYPRR